MKISFDGLRKGIARSYNDIAVIFLDSGKEKEDMAEAIESLRQYVGTLLAVYGEEKDIKELDFRLINIEDDR
jgi:hypothetical protein